MSKAFWVAPPENPEFYKAIRWLERVAESDHPSSPNAQSLLDALKDIYFRDEADHIDSALGNESAVFTAWLALKTSEMADLNFVVAHTPRTRNKAVAIRKLIRQEAKRIRQELKENANVG
jgi:hypothetical protein